VKKPDKILKKKIFGKRVKKDGYTQNTNINMSLTVVEANALSYRQR